MDNMIIDFVMANTSMVLATDSYKHSQFPQTPPGTTMMNYYIEPRGGQFPVVVPFGYQHHLKKQLTRRVTQAEVEEAADFCAEHGVPFNRAGWERIVNVHNGFLPLYIEALPEGLVVPVKNAIIQLRNTDPALHNLAGHVETGLLRDTWYGSTVATWSWHAKQIIQRYLEQTGDVGELEFKLQDFGARGASSQESAQIGGMAHLVNFQGSDNIEAIMAARRHYGIKMAGFSIPASEHSTITSWGVEHEMDAYENMLIQFAKPGAKVACVSDSTDLWVAVDAWGTRFRKQIEESGATLIVRPDSGVPEDIVPAVIQRLMGHLGYALNKQGYAVLPKCIRVIQGDGINLESLERILAACKSRGLSADNVSFGVGGALLQMVNRDTMRWAMKCSAAEIRGHVRDVQKNPATDRTKASKPGILAVVADPYTVVKTIRASDLNGRKNLLEPAFNNGILLRDQTMAEIRVRANHGLRLEA